jgi:hypothetical protein
MGMTENQAAFNYSTLYRLLLLHMEILQNTPGTQKAQEDTIEMMKILRATANESGYFAPLPEVKKDK